MHKDLVIPLLCSIAIASILLSTIGPENEQQSNRLTEKYHITPVPIPSKISFANEEVPLNKFEVKERLDRELLVNTYWQSNSILILKRTKKYFKIIEPILAKNGIPEDFKYLAVTESGLQNVTSSSGAKGIWQFMASSGKEYGLEINNNIDERYNLEKSTEAACKYIKEAYYKFGKWTLAAAAYNRGMNGITYDIKKQLVKDYYDLHLNTETSRYVLRILAFKTIIENPKSYGFNLETFDYYAAIPSRTIKISKSIPNISEYAQEIGTNYHVLKSLNPWIISNELTVTDSSYYNIKAPLVD